MQVAVYAGVPAAVSALRRRHPGARGPGPERPGGEAAVSGC